jgi:hypothetical protein
MNISMKQRLSLAGVAGLIAAASLQIYFGHLDPAMGENNCKGPGIALSNDNGYVYLQGSICPGDGTKFINYMKRAGSGIRFVRLNNTGGLGVEAIKIGRYIRNHGMSTWTDGREDVCASACNRIFAGGNDRIYSHAKWITTGKNPDIFNGLGYHYPRVGDSRDLNNPFYRSVIAPYLTEMLPPQAADWVIKTDEGNLTGQMVWLNGGEALQLGIATGLKIPASLLGKAY